MSVDGSRRCPPPLVAATAALCARLARCEATGDLPTGHDPDADRDREDLLSALEALKNAAGAMQARLAVDLDGSVRAQDAAAGKPAEARGRDVAHRVALARGESPNRGRMLLGLAKDLHTDLPCALAAMRTGLLSEFRASMVDREIGCLSREDREKADAELFAPSAETGPAEALFLGTRRLIAAARAIACRLDPAGVARRRARAENERCVTLRPAPEGMAYLTGLLPMAQGIAAHVALTRRADAAKAAGDQRGKGQIMADLLVESFTRTGPGATSGGADAARPAAAPVAVTVDLVISDRALLGGGNEPAFLLGCGVPASPIDAQGARTLVAEALDAYPESLAWIRRLYADEHGRLVAMSSTQRFAPRGLAEFLRIRDQGVCRTPWCDAPIAQIDDVIPTRDGGATQEWNSQGYCSACNDTKNADGWKQRTGAGEGGRHTVTTVTPTGRTYRTSAPAPPRPAQAHPPPAA